MGLYKGEFPQVGCLRVPSSSIQWMQLLLEDPSLSSRTIARETVERIGGLLAYWHSVSDFAAEVLVAVGRLLSVPPGVDPRSPFVCPNAWGQLLDLTWLDFHHAIDALKTLVSCQESARAVLSKPLVCWLTFREKVQLGIKCQVATTDAAPEGGGFCMYPRDGSSGWFIKISLDGFISMFASSFGLTQRDAIISLLELVQAALGFAIWLQDVGPDAACLLIGIDNTNALGWLTASRFKPVYASLVLRMLFKKFPKSRSQFEGGYISSVKNFVSDALSRDDDAVAQQLIKSGAVDRSDEALRWLQQWISEFPDWAVTWGTLESLGLKLQSASWAASGLQRVPPRQRSSRLTSGSSATKRRSRSSSQQSSSSSASRSANGGSRRKERSS